MSIPFDEDPLGECLYVDFIQPQMTSNTTWGNKPSFGMSLSAEGADGDVWKAFDGDAETAWEGQCPANARITLRAELEHPILMSTIHIRVRSSNTAQFYVYGVDVDGGFALLKPLVLQPALRDFVVKVPESLKNNKYKGLRMAFMTLSTVTFTVYECAIEGAFDPADIHS